MPARADPAGCKGCAVQVPFAGGCRCGAVRYVCRASPETVLNCYCRDCQRATGGACATVAVVPAAALVVERGEPSVHDVRAESGYIARRRFCPTCGSPLFAGSLAHPESVGVYVATLDDAAGVAPALEIWTRSRPSWARLDPGLPSFARGRPRT
jgi:hypothetical protein